VRGTLSPEASARVFMAGYHRIPASFKKSGPVDVWKTRLRNLRRRKLPLSVRENE
jgi:hypothetical protein